MKAILLSTLLMIGMTATWQTAHAQSSVFGPLPEFTFRSQSGSIHTNPHSDDLLFCGDGIRFPVLIWGERPLHVCILRRPTENRFGGPFGF